VIGRTDAGLSPLIVPQRRARWPSGEWGYSTRRHMLEPVRPEAVLPDRTLYLPTFSHITLVAWGAGVCSPATRTRWCPWPRRAAAATRSIRSGSTRGRSRTTRLTALHAFASAQGVSGSEHGAAAVRAADRALWTGRQGFDSLRRLFAAGGPRKRPRRSQGVRYFDCQ
jgi:hypothetical protein